MAASQGTSCFHVLSVLVLQASALESSIRAEPYKFLENINLLYRRSNEVCRICVTPNFCAEIEPHKCEYYMAASELVSDGPPEPEPSAAPRPGLRADVDSMLSGLAASVEGHQFNDCIPFLSRYTNCNKENVCMGCKSCECDALGRWNCTISQKCRPDTLRASLDHRTLRVVLDNLRKEDINTNRVKRHIEDLSDEKETGQQGEKITHDMLSEWMYGAPVIDEEPLAHKYSVEESLDSSDEDDSEIETVGLIIQKTDKILHDLLYEMSENTPEFDGNSNKVKRSAEITKTYSNTNRKDDPSSIEGVVNDDALKWLNNKTRVMDELKVTKHKSKTNKEPNHENFSRDLNKTLAKIKKVMFQVKTVTEMIKKIVKENINATTSGGYTRMSEIHDFLLKSFPFGLTLDNKTEYSNSKSAGEELFKKKHSTEKVHSKSLPKNQLPNTFETTATSKGKIDKRSIDDSAGNANDINYYAASKLNGSFVKNNINQSHDNNLEQLTKQDISEWLNDQHPLHETNDIAPTAFQTTTIENKADHFMSLKDVDGGVSDSNKTNVRRKPPLNLMHAELVSNDYMYDDDDVTYVDEFMEEKNYNYTSDNANSINTLTATKSTTEYLKTTEVVEATVTEVVIDLLESAKKKLKKGGDKAGNATVNKLDNIYNMMDPVQDTNEIDDGKLSPGINVLKRDVAHVVQNDIEATTTVSDATVFPHAKPSANSSNTIRDLMHDVLLPLNNILNERQKELNELIKMKNGLITFIKSSQSYDSALNLNLSSTTNTTQNRNSYFSVYKLEIVPNFDVDRRTNVSILDRYMSKLKHDVYEVIRDIVAIQKLHSDPSKVPGDIKFLINAMKQYVHKKGFHIQLKNKNEKTLRRHMPPQQDEVDSSDIKKRIIKIIELLDKDMPQDNVLSALSPTAGNILKRIIKTYYTDEFSVVGLRVHDPHYNLTNDLSNIGVNWEAMTKELYTGTPTSTLYKMKTLHRVLSSDINKMVDALSLIDFARNRRMMPIDEQAGEDIMKRITNDLERVYFEMLHLRRRDSEAKQLRHRQQYLATGSKKKKESFIKQLKNLLVNSKRDILSLFRKKVPKSEIVKELARKRLDRVTRERLSEYADTMRRWQAQLNVPVNRKKRAAGPGTDNFNRRMNNILPKYLRGKVPSAIASPRAAVGEKLKPVKEFDALVKFRKIGVTTEPKKLNKLSKKKKKLGSMLMKTSVTKKLTKKGNRKTGVKTQSHVVPRNNAAKKRNKTESLPK